MFLQLILASENDMCTYAPHTRAETAQEHKHNPQQMAMRRPGFQF